MVATSFCRAVQDAHACGPQPARLPTGCLRGIPALHDAAAVEGSFQNALFPRRRALGAEATKQPALVQDGEWVGGFVSETITPCGQSSKSGHAKSWRQFGKWVIW